jgi:hypothetical protein
LTSRKVWRRIVAVIRRCAMRPEEIHAMLRAEPFTPLRVRLKNGTIYEIIYPNLTMATQPFLVIAFPDPESGGRWGLDDYVTVPWPEIATVEPMKTEGAAA